MTKNEKELLEDWIKYHGFVFGLQNLSVLDGSNDPLIEDIYAKYQPMGLDVVRTSTNLNGLAQELTELMHARKGDDDFVIKLDTDEFLAMASDVGDTGRQVTATGIDAMLSDLPRTGQRYRAGFTQWSLPHRDYVSAPARDIVEFTPLQETDILKALFHAGSFIETDLGCHVGKTTQNEGFINTPLILIHYHSTSITDAMRRAKQVLVSHEYIGASDTEAEQIEKLQKLSGKRRNSYHKIALYLQYLTSRQSGEAFPLSSLNEAHPFYEKTQERQRLSLVRDVLLQADEYFAEGRPDEVADHTS